MSATAPSRFVSMSLGALLACGLAAGHAPADAAPAKAKSAVAKSARKAPAKPAEVPIPDAPPDQVTAAELVYYGVYDCEFKQTVHITQSPRHSAYVDVKSGKGLWLMKPVLSSTGAVRLEDVRGETLMVQIAAKSMLLNVKTAQRIVDDCISPKQRELMAEAKVAKAAAEAATVKAMADAATSTAPIAPMASTPIASTPMAGAGADAASAPTK